MSTHVVRAAIALALALIPLASANAHCFVGGRFFPAMLATDDPCVADEMSSPTVQWNSANPAGREHDVGGDFAKRITETFGITVSSTLTRVSPPANAGTVGPVAYGFQNLVTTAQFQVLKDAPSELALLAGVIASWGNTGAAGVGAPSWGTITPTFYFGKGWGDLPCPPCLTKDIRESSRASPQTYCGLRAHHHVRQRKGVCHASGHHLCPEGHNLLRQSRFMANCSR
jgi:hypothetical protein